MNTVSHRLALGLVCLWAATAPVRAEVIGNWDFSTGSLEGTAGSQLRLRHAPETSAYATYRAAYDAYYAPTYGSLAQVPQLAYGATGSFGIQSLGNDGRTVLQVSDARGAGQLTGLIADFDPSSTGSGKINTFTVIMDVLIPTITFDAPNRWVSLFQPRANADGLVFVDTNKNEFGVADGYASGFQPDTWHRIAMVIDLTAAAGQPRYMTYRNGVLAAAIETPGAGRDPTVDGPLSIGSLMDSNPSEAPGLFNGLADASNSTMFFFNDEDGDLGTLYVANLQFRDTALSAAEISYLGGPTMTAIAVPEPRTWSMAAVGVAALVLARGLRLRRRGSA